MVLVAKNLLPPGKGLYEAVEERLEGDILTARDKIRERSSLEAVRVEAGSLPTAFTDELDEDETERLAGVFQYAALQAGYEPDDPCLHWFRDDLIEEFWPSLTALMNFEAELLEAAGKVAIADGRAKAFLEMQKKLGRPSHAERKDWTALPMAYVRDFQGMSTEDDRTLMVARLEDIVTRAVDALDLGKALAGLRSIAQIQGLTFQDEERSNRQFALLFAKAHERNDELAVVRDSAVTKRLTAG